MAPGFTADDKNLVHTGDVTGLRRRGLNTWDDVNSDGWFGGRTGHQQIAITRPAPDRLFVELGLVLECALHAHDPAAHVLRVGRLAA